MTERPDFLHDRLTGARAPMPDGQPVLGRWMLQVDGAVINGVSARSLDYVAPTGGTGCRVRGPGGLACDVRFVEETLVDARSTLALNVGRIGDLATASGWDGLWNTSPLAHDVDATAVHTGLDRAIDRLLRNLEHVCAEPRAQLTVEVERVPVGRARRPPTSATAFLAAHPEDWERRTLQGIVPARVQTRYFEDELDIYENRVAVRLVSHLIQYLSGRVKDIRSAADEARDPSHLDGARWKTDRVYELWAEMIGGRNPEVIEAALHQTLETIRRLLRRLHMLRRSRLCRRVQGRVEVGRTLRPTNILLHDPNYRRVAELWQAYQAELGGKPPTPEEAFETHQRWCRAFDDYALVLVARGLKALGFESADGRVLDLDAGAVMYGPGGYRIDVRRTDDRSIALEASNSGTEAAVSLRVVPIASRLTASASAFAEALRGLAVSGAMTLTGENERATAVLVVYPSEPSERQGLPYHLRLRANAPTCERAGFDDYGEPRLAPVSPFDVNSVERVGRALRWWLLETLYTSYPPIVDVPRQVREMFADGAGSVWLPVDREGRARLCRLPSEGEHAALLVELERRKQARSGDARRARRSRATERELREWDAAFERLGSILDRGALAGRLAPYQACPVCHCVLESGLYFEARDRDCFWANCPECGTAWGLRVCGTCDGRYPVLHLDGGTGILDVPNGDRIDERLGCDVLAIPCQRQDPDEDVYICARCGSCRDRARGATNGCERCRAYSDRPLGAELRRSPQSLSTQRGFRKTEV